MLKNKLATLPMEPGCYLMKDRNGEVIYVGKAKKLKNRVNSYFTGSHDNKTTKLVSNIADFDFIVTPSDKEAFILEFNLIKKYRPKFNIMFMDDSSYPYIRLTREQYPTIKLVRDRKKMKNAVYFGPYPNVTYARELVGLLEKLYPLRKCNVMPGKVCLYYHLGLCLGPCEHKIEKDVYQKMTDSIVSFMKGNTREIRDHLTQLRDEYSERMMYEKAQEQQQLLEAIDHVTANQLMQSNGRKNSMDVFNYHVDRGYISIVGLLYSQGQLLHRHNLLKPVYDEPQEAFVSYIQQYYASNELPGQLLLPPGEMTEGLKEVLDCEVLIPQRGDKVRMIELAKENASVILNQKFDILNREQINRSVALQQLESLVHSSTGRIELYDNSHISGSNAVAGEVVYIDGKPSKKDYRLYKVTNGNNDFANMQEVLYRRLFRALKEKTVLPDIIIVDGGESQIRAAREILDDLQITSVKLLGLVKNDRHQTASLMDDDYQIIEIDRQSELFYLMTNMQDEVHRFAISYHKRLRSKQMSHSSLEEIEGVGPKRRSSLLKHFGSIARIREANVEQLSQAVPAEVAQRVYDYYHQQPVQPDEDELML
ncbi:MAG: excinuclease ABC subunit UvrC [Erysipelotrichaceae bacterium]|nr:excinuclease ABC subunit UvrC [Erysipelotrichaceae bacterium]MBR5049253.1 excinuclease ABC subunit UvrC [Erysipelotrichaceae bacterium]